jgi:hypothetical protein
MGFEYRHRRGQTYYFHARQTKTGKPKYYFARKSERELVIESVLTHDTIYAS